MLPSPQHHPPPVPLTGTSPPPIDGGRRGGLGSSRTNFVRISYEFTPISTVSLSHSSQSHSSHLLLTMSQQIMSQLASLASRPDPAANTLARTNSYEIRANFTFS